MQILEYVSNDPNRRTKLTHPYNYNPFTVWKGLEDPNGSAYTDRLYQWDCKKHDDLCMKHFGDKGQYWDCREIPKIQDFLRDYFDDENLILCEVQEHCNQATGYPCWFFSYKYTQKEAT